MKKIIYLITGVCILLIATAGFAALRLKNGKVLYPKEDILPGQEVVFYRQDDPKWEKESLGVSSYTMKSSGCLVTCIASAAAMSFDEEVTPGSLNTQFSSQKVYDDEGNIQWDGIRNMGYEAEVYGGVSEEILENDLKEGRYPIVRVRMHGIGNFHYVLVVKAEKGMFYCMDPLADGLRPLSDYGNRVYAVRCVYPAGL